MPDYIYLLANRLSPSQQSALQSIREIAREAGMTVFLTGGAVRDLTSGSPVRDLDVSVQGNALDLKAKLIEVGALLWGEHVPSQTLFARFPGSVRVEVSSTRREEFPKPGKPEYHPGSILEDLRRRDFTANAMALSLNEGSYGLLMDPLNGVADLEARVLRLVSNYGFLEDPIRMVRAVRLQARLGWELEEKTKVRFENAREEGLIEQVPAFQQGYEVEEIVHEEDGFKILKALEADGWMKFLFPAWTSAKVDTEALDSLREVLVQLQMQGVNPDPSAAQAQLLTAKLPSKDLAALKKLFVRQGFVHEWETQEERAKEVGKRLIGKEASMPSAAWKLLTSSDPEAVLWLALTSKSAPIQARLKEFFTVWPEARQRIPYALMQEMRITPELEGYQDLLKSIFFELIDGKLTSDEEIRQFLEPHSPPAPPPPVSIRRTRSKKSAEKNREVRDMDEDEIGDARPERDEDSEDEEEIDEESDAGDGRSELVVRPMLQIVPPPPPVIPPAAKPAPELSVVPVALEEQHPEAPRTGAKPKLKSVGELAILATRSAVKSDAAEPSNEPNKSASNRTPAKPIAKTAAKPTARSTAKPTVKPELVKSALKPAVKAAKPIAKPAEKPKPALKKAAVKSAVVKKASVKTGAKGKLPAKAKPAQAILKAKPVPSRSAPAKKSSVATKVSAKSAPAKKRR